MSAILIASAVAEIVIMGMEQWQIANGGKEVPPEVKAEIDAKLDLADEIWEAAKARRITPPAP